MLLVNTLKHPPGCLQFAKNDREEEKMERKRAREEGEERKGETPPAVAPGRGVSCCVCMYVGVSGYVFVCVLSI